MGDVGKHLLVLLLGARKLLHDLIERTAQPLCIREVDLKIALRHQLQTLNQQRLIVQTAAVMDDRYHHNQQQQRQ